ncbi:hypothetical protein BH09BAC1_BH09BAC1_12100 [soil metagenome]
MFPPKLRFALVVICVLVGIYSFTQAKLFPGVALLVVAGLLVYGHISYNRIWLIYKHVLSGEFEQADTQLKKVGSLGNLSKEHQSYYHFSKGMVAMHKTAYEEAEAELQQALDIGLKTDNDMAVANFYLAQIYYNQTSYKIAREYLDTAKKYQIHPTLQTHVNQLDIVLRQGEPK